MRYLILLDLIINSVHDIDQVIINTFAPCGK